MTRVSVIIINYNTFALTSGCIRSVIAHTTGLDYEIVLVDNASSECDPGKFSDAFPGIKLIKSPVNGGFAAGNNLGIDVAKGEYILLLNSDTIITENSIKLAYDHIQEQTDAGVVGCRMVFPDNQVQYTARKFRTISWELLDLFRFIPYLMSYPARSKKMLGKYFRHNENKEADWVNGAFFLFPAKLLEKMPGNKLDERFFMYGEDQLWCEQIRNQGYKILFFAGTTIIHINSGSTDIKKQLKLRKTMLRHELEIMRNRKGRGAYYFFFKVIYVTKESIRNFLKAIILLFTGKLVR